MKRRTTILVALIAATLALGAMPALAIDTERPAERPRPERTFPPEWIDQTPDELRDQAVERAAELEENAPLNSKRESRTRIGSQTSRRLQHSPASPTLSMPSLTSTSPPR